MPVVITALVVAGALGSLATGPALADGTTYLTVGSCSGGGYPTIQAAVDAAAPNSHITVCPGTYSEQVNIPAGLGGLVLTGAGGNSTVIQFPTVGESANGPDGADAVVSMSPGAGDDYRLANLTIEGPWTDGANGRHFGVFVVGAGIAEIDHDTISNIEDVNSDPASRSNYDGFGVAIGDSGVFDDGSSEVPGNAIIDDSTIQNYQTLGVTVTVSGSNGWVRNSTIQGLAGGSPQDFLVGLVLADGANALVDDNNISGNYDQSAVAGNDATQGDGIFAGFAPGKVLIKDNYLTGNDIGLEIQGASGLLDGNDRMINNNYDGIHIDASDPFGDSTSNNTLFNDHAGNNGVANGGFDCEDDTTGAGTAGTADVWMNDHGTTMTPAGICKSQDWTLSYAPMRRAFSSRNGHRARSNRGRRTSTRSHWSLRLEKLHRKTRR